MKTIQQLLKQQQSYFHQTGGVPLNQRILHLKRLKAGLKKFVPQIEQALKQDLGKSQFEAFATEIGFLYLSINHTLKHLRKWAQIKRVPNDIAQIPGASYIYPSAYGSVLIIGPFN